MKQRIQSIFVLMTVCILGVVAFQAYWLYTSYQLHEQQFRRTMRGAFISAVEKQQFNDARRLFWGETPDDAPEERLVAKRLTDSVFWRTGNE